MVGAGHHQQQSGMRVSHACAAAGLAPNGYTLVADTLARLGVRLMFGVVGIPVTELASAAQVPLLPPSC